VSGGIVIVIPADESLPLKSRHDVAESPTLDELHEIVGGFIEPVPHWDDYMGMPCVVWCNEEGKLRGLPLNRRATMLWYAKLGQPVDDVLVGNVVLCIGFEEKDADDVDDE